MKMLRSIGLALLVAGSLATTARASSDEEQILTLEQQWVDASAQGDSAFIRQLLDDGFVNINVQGLVRDKNTVLSARPLPPGASQRLSGLTVRLHGDTAVVTGTNTVRMDLTASPVAVAYTDVYRKRRGQWHAISAQETFRH
ncbi:nuclear transport factor 2 family protein [Pseudomonas sp. PDM17]|nr:nuclear transport factor 2 family protein [Pseudomonas sp. PDM17]